MTNPTSQERQRLESPWSRSNFVAVIAVGVALAAAGITIKTKLDAADPSREPLKPPGHLATYTELVDQLERTKRRLSKLQALAADKGFYGEQDCPDEEPIPGVYPQLIYDRGAR